MSRLKVNDIFSLAICLKLVSQLAYSWTPKMEATYSPETSANFQWLYCVMFQNIWLFITIAQPQNLRGTHIAFALSVHKSSTESETYSTWPPRVTCKEPKTYSTSCHVSYNGVMVTGFVMNQTEQSCATKRWWHLHAAKRNYLADSTETVRASRFKKCLTQIHAVKIIRAIVEEYSRKLHNHVLHR